MIKAEFCLYTFASTSLLLLLSTAGTTKSRLFLDAASDGAGDRATESEKHLFYDACTNKPCC